MKIAFWKKEEENEDDFLSKTSDNNDDLTSNFGGPELEEPSALSSAEDFKPKFDDYSGIQKPNVEQSQKNYSKEDLIEAKLDAVKNKMEIIDHKLDIIISRLKDVY